jgi:outer membrane lipoprotein carrier protein
VSAAARASIVLAAALALAAPAHAGPARERFATAMRGLKNARASFVQTRSAGALGSQKSRGTLELAMPGRARLEYAGAAPMTIVLHSDTAWVYQPSQKQVLRSSAAASGVPPLPVRTAPERLDERYRVDEVGPNALVFRLKGDGVTSWETLTLTLDARGLPRRVDIVLAGGSTTSLAFERFRVNPGVPTSRFTRAWPAGTPVVAL